MPGQFGQMQGMYANGQHGGGHRPRYPGVGQGQGGEGVVGSWLGSWVGGR